MKAVDLIKKMELYVHSALYACELAVAANSAMSFSEEKWSTGPSLHSAANRPRLDKTILPLALKTSELFQLAIHVINDFKTPEKGKGGGRKFINIHEMTKPEEIMSAQTILYLFCLLEEYEFYVYEKELSSNLQRICNDDKYTLKDVEEYGIEGIRRKSIDRHMAEYQFSSCRKRIKRWGRLGVKELSENQISLYEVISKRRNELTHLSSPEPASRLEALNYYLVCRNIVRYISICFGDKSIDEVDVDWEVWSELEHSIQNDSSVNDLAKMVRDGGARE
ncbi:hypothetical protein MEW69_004538 [Klebsiella pneumoniae]|nr:MULTISPECIES: hypothetical protein [Enterobacterales]EGT5653386.1 hypothetical protein [Cronobacter sakazakii]HBC7113551.1 hypothetical protein [Raoultella ornithinolytica]HBS2860658.1 hypothetical protein [Klebsiella variicola subsp. variicola]HCI5645681.1 hypothetical protein [Klebsiella quasipneumoniae subsp. similipneumoniae]AOP91834.1 hypothetical protein BFV63_13395 [Enterobacter hormaechei subsp. xiangfangensis]